MVFIYSLYLTNMFNLYYIEYIWISHETTFDIIRYFVNCNEYNNVNYFIGSEKNFLLIFAGYIIGFYIILLHFKWYKIKLLKNMDE